MWSSSEILPLGDASSRITGELTGAAVIMTRLSIAIFFGNILRDKRNSVFPHFSPKKSVFSGHEWSEARHSRSHEWPEYTDFAGGKAGENRICRIDYNMTKEGYFFLSLRTFWVLSLLRHKIYDKNNICHTIIHPLPTPPMCVYDVWHHWFIVYWILSQCSQIPRGLMDRIPDCHPGGPGSIPRRCTFL